MELLHRTILTTLGALSLIYVLIKFSLGYWKRRGILHEKPKFLWGNIKGVLPGKRHMYEALQFIYDNYKERAPFVGFYACIKPFVFVLDLDLVRHILVTDAGHFTTRGLYHNVNNEPLSGNLLQLDGHKWRALHAQTKGVFTPSNMQKLLPQLLQVQAEFQNTLATKVKERQTINISELVDNYNTDVISSLAFGLSGNSLQFPQTEFHQMTRNYWNNFKLWKAYLSLEFPTLARLLQHKSYDECASEYFQKLVHTQLQQQRNTQRRDGEQLFNFLQFFSATERPLSDVQIAAQAFGFILAGMVPLNATLSFCLYELALKPELQERTRLEINKVLQQHNGLTAESLRELKYTKQVLNETLRLHTPYPFLLRRTTKSFEVPKSVFVIAHGNNVIIPTAAIHRDASIYEEPLRFDPARFEAKAVNVRSDMSFLPFGAGLRGCIAQQFAEMQLLVGLVALLQHHRYTPCADTVIPLQYDTRKLLLVPKTDIRLIVERIDSK